MATAHNLQIALDLAAQGRPVFALSGGKVPYLGSHGHLDASTDPDEVRHMMRRPSAVPGLAVRESEVFIDVDPRNGGDCGAIGLRPEDADVRTPGGGWHFNFRNEPGLRLGNGILPGIDLKANGSYVVAPGARLLHGGTYEGSVPARPPQMPRATLRKLVAALEERPKVHPAERGQPMTSREQILAWLGPIAGGGKLTPSVAQAMLDQAYADGDIADADPDRPWPPAFKVLAREAAKWSGPPPNIHRRERPPATVLDTIDTAVLLRKELRPLMEIVPGYVYEGLGMLVGGPKKGKSWLAYQIAVAVATGGKVLGQQAHKGDVLYLALEDGERRGQSRINTVLRHLGHSWPRDANLELAWNAERGDAVVAQVEEWISRHPAAVLVIVDTLQRIRPGSSGKRNQYEVDVEDLSRVMAIAQRHQGLAILLVHHDRKAVATDFLDSASGTHGITGSVDTVLALKRERLDVQGTLEVTSRDGDERRAYLRFGDPEPVWVVDPQGGMTAKEVEVWDWLRKHGPAGPSAVGDAVGMDRTNAHRVLRALVNKEVLAAQDGEYRLPIVLQRHDNDDNEENDNNNDNGDNEDNG